MSRTPPEPAEQGRAEAVPRTSFFSYRRERPLVFAHRGGCALGPENTLAAFDAGLAAGADGLELDVHLSADNIPVVHHDATLDRTTDCTGPVAARTAAELSRVNAGRRFAPAGQAGNPRATAADQALIGVPALAEVLRRYPQVPIIIEMKEDSERMGRAVAQVVAAAHAGARVCAAGYGSRSLAAFRRETPHVDTSAAHTEVRWALYRSWTRWPVRRPAWRGYQVPEFAGWIRVVSPAFIRHAHAAGLQVQVWTVDQEDDMRRLIAWGADALITNRPDLARQVVDTAGRGEGER
jgi:glycerophosphoryl diester phosphodiesterase